MSAVKIINEALTLPVEERVIIIESLMKTLNPVDQEVENFWIDLSVQRLKDINDGISNFINGEDVFNRIRKRFQ